MYMEIKKGQIIEKESRTLIAHVLDYYAVPSYGRFLVERAVHATADFSLATLFCISANFVEHALDSLSRPVRLYCDVEMVKSGLSPALLKTIDVRPEVLVHQPECFTLAARNHLTRSEAAVDLAVSEGFRVFVFGNTPTGVERLIAHIRKGYEVEWVIAVPVGFVKAAQVKNEIFSLPVSSVIMRGPRGGSPIAASLVNGLMEEKLKNTKTNRESTL